jgi:hypothetical protein
MTATLKDSEFQKKELQIQNDQLNAREKELAQKTIQLEGLLGDAKLSKVRLFSDF